MCFVHCFVIVLVVVHRFGHSVPRTVLTRNRFSTNIYRISGRMKEWVGKHFKLREQQRV